MSFRFIITSTFIFIVYTVSGFLWHNNIFQNIYYNSSSLYKTSSQNIVAMNFANALYIYGLVYFATNHLVRKFTGYLKFALYYSISVQGYHVFMTYGMVKEIGTEFILAESLWIIISSLLCAFMIFNFKKFVNN